MKFVNPKLWGRRVWGISLLLVLLWWGPLQGGVFPEKQSRVLFISSYHPGFPTFFQQIEGVREAFGDRRILLDVEFMDSKRFPERANRDRFTASLSYKLARTTPYDLVMTADDNALIFALEHRDDLLRNLPVVFLGVNNLERAMAQDRNPRFTGVVEAVSMAETIRVMTELLPGTTRILALTDGTPSGRGDLDTFYALAERFPAHGFSHLSLSDFSWADFQGQLRALTRDTAVLLLSAYGDKAGRTVLFDESLRRIREALSLPLFHLWFHGMGDGILGGKLISHRDQGRAAGEIALRVLDGTPVDQIPVVTVSPNRFYFDYLELSRHDIDADRLPPDHDMINGPDPVYPENMTLIWSVLAVIVILAVSLLFSLLNLFRRRHMERQLRISEKKHREMIANISDVITVMDRDGTILYESPNVEKWFGWQPGERIGTDGLETVHPDDRPRIRQVFTGLCRADHQTSRIVEYRYQCKNGQYRWIELKGVNLVGDSVIRGILVNYHDITVRRMTDQALRDSEALFKVAVEQSPIAMLVAVNKAILTVNKKFTSLFGYTRDEIPDAAAFRQRLFPDDAYRTAVRFLWDWETAPDPGSGIENLAVRFHCKNGDEKQVRVHATLSGDTRLIAFVDQTELRQYEMEKKVLEKQLRQSQKLEAIGTLAGGIAHDFNNILGIILGYTEMARDRMSADADAKRQLRQVTLAGNRAKDLVAQILAFSRQGENEWLPIRPDLIVKETLQMLRASIPSYIEIRQEIFKCGSVMGDPTQMHQVVLNLCTNAYQAMRETGGVLGIQLKQVSLDQGDAPVLEGALPPGPYIRLTVSDNGHGMDAAVREKIFDPYFTTKKKGEGTGLGLAVAHGVVTAFGGHIRVTSEPGSGTCFQVFLPRIDDRLESGSRRPPCPVSAGGEHILVVDDEASIAQMVKTMLESLGYRVSVSTDSRRALDLFRKKSTGFSLILTDMAMPGMTGVDLVEAARQIRPDIPVVLCTGFSELIDEEKASQMGIGKYLMKPVLKKDLALAVREVLDGIKSG